MAHVRMEPEARKALILDAAYKLVKKQGFKKATRTAIAEAAGVTAGLVGVYFGKRAELRTTLFKLAVDNKDVKLIRDGLDLGIGEGVRIPKDLRAAATR
ncbi:gp59 [Burkholderia phage BcepB1A]|uniref:gp59 n=1 Tax=Burkholderia phage BcepB1A TaxID=279530 RepID=UPI000053EA6E|nr:gp59 [Burkholderia phage BcepB1A]AAY87925.1 gp59 [Burkholderia phage BcepB1A]